MGILSKSLSLVALTTTASLAALTTPALAQGYDEGVARTAPLPDAEGAQFEDVPRQGVIRQAPAHRASAPLSNQRLQALNAEARKLEADLNGDGVMAGILPSLRALDRVLARNEPGEYIVQIYVGETEEQAQGDTLPLGRSHVLLTGQEVAASIDRLYPEFSIAQKQAAYRRIVQASAAARANLAHTREQLWKARDAKLARLDQIRRMVMADADRPGQGYDPAAAGGSQPGPSFAWDTRVRVHGIECFGGTHHQVYTDHYSLNGKYVGSDSTEYHRVRREAAAGGGQFCGAWETRRETMKK